jgi:hypothetical protein
VGLAASSVQMKWTRRAAVEMPPPSPGSLLATSYPPGYPPYHKSAPGYHRYYRDVTGNQTRYHEFEPPLK